MFIWLKEGVSQRPVVNIDIPSDVPLGDGGIFALYRLPCHFCDRSANASLPTLEVEWHLENSLERSSGEQLPSTTPYNWRSRVAASEMAIR